MSNTVKLGHCTNIAHKTKYIGIRQLGVYEYIDKKWMD